MVSTQLLLPDLLACLKDLPLNSLWEMTGDSTTEIPDHHLTSFCVMICDWKKNYYEKGNFFFLAKNEGNEICFCVRDDSVLPLPCLVPAHLHPHLFACLDEKDLSL